MFIQILRKKNEIKIGKDSVFMINNSIFNPLTSSVKDF